MNELHPIVRGQVICVALNDSRRLAELNAQFNEVPYKSPPGQPVLYFKPRNTWNIDGAVLPWLVEESGDPAENCVVGASLGVVIGEETCRVAPDQVDGCVEGLTLVHDFSLPEASYFRPDIRGKCQDGSAAVGPGVTPISDTSELKSLDVITSVNGEVRGNLPMDQMYRSVAQLISEISWIMTLSPGNVVATGFPGERICVQPGDVVSSTIAGIGTLTNTIGAPEARS